MKTVRDLFVPFVADLLLPSGEVNAPFAFGEGEQREATGSAKPKLMDAAAKWLREPANRRAAQSVIWVGLVLITVLLSALFFVVGKTIHPWNSCAGLRDSCPMGIIVGYCRFILPAK